MRKKDEKEGRKEKKKEKRKENIAAGIHWPILPLSKSPARNFWE